MRKEKALIALLRDLVALLAEESDRNPTFAARLDEALRAIPDRKPPKPKAPKAAPVELPDFHAELEARGDAEFRHWLREQPIPVLRAFVRAQDLDSTRRTTKWKEAEKLADFIADAVRARLARGATFIGRGSGT
jgi:hypothetical protein